MKQTSNVKRNEKDSASGPMSCFKFLWEVNVNISCEMSDSVNLSGICVLTQLYNLPLLSVITSSSYTETRVVSGNAFICLCVLLFIWCYTYERRTSVCECFCSFMCEDLCNGSLFLHMNPLWRHTTRANENAASWWHTHAALGLHAHTVQSVWFSVAV